MPRVYCVVFGCMNNTAANPELSFFKLPKNLERRTKWLHLMSREELIDKPPTNYVVCEEHFNASDVLARPQRKQLKANSLPCLHLPNLQELPKKDAQTLTDVPKLVDTYSQTDNFVIDKGTQTHKYLLSDKPANRKRKQKSDHSECTTKTIKLQEIDGKTKDNQRDILLELCDRFLTKELAGMVKAQTQI